MANRNTIHIKNPKTSLFEVFGPDDKLPAWASKALKDKSSADSSSDSGSGTPNPDPDPDE